MIQNHNHIHFNSGKTINTLETGVYKIRKTLTGIILEKVNNFEYKNLDGRVNDYVELLLEQTKKTNKFGALFSGLSGMGKTQTIKNFITSSNLPTIFIDSAISGDDITTVVNNIETDVIVFIDEFEKVYSREEDANSLLTFLDGSDFKKKLITICSFNERKNLSTYFFNRPGRFIFNFKFDALHPDEALEFISKNVNVKDQSKELLNYLYKIKNLSYDICATIINTIHLHGIDTFVKFSDCLNIDNTTYLYKITTFKDDKPFDNSSGGAIITNTSVKVKYEYFNEDENKYIETISRIYLNNDLYQYILKNLTSNYEFELNTEQFNDYIIQYLKEEHDSDIKIDLSRYKFVAERKHDYVQKSYLAF
jgi:hypothetical protein